MATWQVVLVALLTSLPGYLVPTAIACLPEPLPDDVEKESYIVWFTLKF